MKKKEKKMSEPVGDLIERISKFGENIRKELKEVGCDFIKPNNTLLAPLAKESREKLRRQGN